jgi:hypothetical protein
MGEITMKGKPKRILIENKKMKKSFAVVTEIIFIFFGWQVVVMKRVEKERKMK